MFGDQIAGLVLELAAELGQSIDPELVNRSGIEPMSMTEQEVGAEVKLTGSGVNWKMVNSMERCLLFWD